MRINVKKHRSSENCATLIYLPWPFFLLRIIRIILFWVKPTRRFYAPSKSAKENWKSAKENVSYLAVVVSSVVIAKHRISINASNINNKID